MMEKKNLKPFLERILGKKIKDLVYLHSQEAIKTEYKSKGVVLDVLCWDDEGNVYDVELQTSNKKNEVLRSRIYHSKMDAKKYPPGTNYKDVKEAYVIFICNFDYYEQNRPIYSFQHWCDQDKRLLMRDQAKKVVVNTKGYKDEKISPELREVLHYLDDGTVTGKYTQELDEAVQELINNEERGHEYMLMTAYMAEQKSLGKYENLVEQVRGWRKQQSSKISPKDASSFMRITLPTFESILSLINDHPDWDDEQIVDEVDWELVED